MQYIDAVETYARDAIKRTSNIFRLPLITLAAYGFGCAYLFKNRRRN